MNDERLPLPRTPFWRQDVPSMALDANCECVVLISIVDLVMYKIWFRVCAAKFMRKVFLLFCSFFYCSRFRRWVVVFGGALLIMSFV